jgi:hypothetical protein
MLTALVSGVFHSTGTAVSRAQIRKKTKAQWQKLLDMFAAPDAVCHKGALELDQLAFAHLKDAGMSKIQPLTPETNMQTGRLISGMAMEALQHVVFGELPLKMERNNQSQWCSNFILDCPGSPCTSNATRNALLNTLNPQRVGYDDYMNGAGVKYIYK